MDIILRNLGLADKITAFQQKGISIGTFEYIMGPGCSAESKDMVRNDAGISTGEFF
jgi:hypothetical protein